MKSNRRFFIWDIFLSLSIINALVISAISFMLEWTTTRTFLYGYAPLLLVLITRIRSNRYAPYYVLAAFLLLVFQYALTKKIVYSECVFWLITPYCIMSSLKRCKDYRNIFLITGITIYLINCAVVAYEYVNEQNLFYFQMNYFERFRATGIYGHPLYSALLHSSCMLFILYSRMFNILKILLYIIGFFIVFCYDARTATIVTLISTAILLYKWEYIRLKHLVPIIIVLFVLPYLIDYLDTSGLGGKLFTKEGTKIGVNDPRLVAFEIFFDRSFDDILFGVIDQVKLAERYGVKAVENGLFCMILEYGLIPALAILFLLTLNLYYFIRIRLPKWESMILLGSFIIIAVTSQAMATPYVWNDYMLLIFLFCSNPQVNEHYILPRKKH